jgi:CRP-like cAMP-binding protein
MSELAPSLRPTAVAEIAVARQRRDVAALLGGVGLFAGMDEHDLGRFAPLLRRVELAPGESLWRQGERCQGLAVLIAGEGQVWRQLPGERELEIARLGPGDVLGEIPLLGGGAHSAGVRALGPCSLLLLTRAGFDACTISFEPSANELRRRIVAIVCARLRRALAGLAATAARQDSHPDALPCRTPRQAPQPTAPPRLDYLSRLPLFRGLEPDLVSELIGRGTVLAADRGQVLQQEWTGPGSCYVTLNGVVEDVVHRGGAPLRAGFAGPGHAFGYIGLLDGEPAPVSSVARERSIVLAADREHVEDLLRHGGPRSRPFAAALEGDLIASLETVERARSHLAAARAS